MQLGNVSTTFLTQRAKLSKKQNKTKSVQMSYKNKPAIKTKTLFIQFMLNWKSITTNCHVLPPNARNFILQTSIMYY